jgi:hypothetical protein
MIEVSMGVIGGIELSLVQLMTACVLAEPQSL